jgi:phage terminase large subunit-like protein
MKPSEIRDKAEADLEFCIALLDPTVLLSACHREVIRYWTNPDAGSHQLLLFPRDHMKSRLVAYWCVWQLIKNPITRILYLSSTSNLAEKQLGFMKRLLASDTVRRYWPSLVNAEEGKRAKWTNYEIELDHPDRHIQNIRDPSIYTAGLTTSVTGLHFDIVVMDDVVVQENAYTQEGRNKVRSQYLLISSIEGTDARQKVVGTRYHPKDLYNDMLEMRMDIYDDSGEKIGTEPVYEVFERKVEDRGDGTGSFLWPRVSRTDGKWFGFNQAILARKRAQYLDKTQFRAQYYNDPTDQESNPIQRDHFQYIDSSKLTRREGTWHFAHRRLSIVAAMDFAWTVGVKKRDYSCVAVVGRDEDNNFYVLDIIRFQTDEMQEYFKQLLVAYNKWGFRRVACETNAAGKVIVKNLRTDYLLRHSIPLELIEVPRTSHEGSKLERTDAMLIPAYTENKVFHAAEGNIQFLEDELLVRHPAHDDCKDAVATAFEYSTRPPRRTSSTNDNVVTFHKRFGGRAF